MDIRTLDTDPRTLLLFSWEQGTEPIKNILRKNPGLNNIIVLIDPETGFSSAEAETAKEKGSHLVSPRPNILCTETAAVAALSIIGHDFFW